MSESNLVDDPIELLLHSFFTTINLSGIVKKVSRHIKVRKGGSSDVGFSTLGFDQVI